MVKPIRVAEDIVPIGQFKGKAGQWLRQIAETGQRLIITQNGKAAGVLMSPAEFDKLRYQQMILQDIAAGAADVEAGRTVTTAQLKRELARARSRRNAK